MPGMNVTMAKFKDGRLKSGSGQTVTNPDQAIAIGMSEMNQDTRRKAIKRRMGQPVSEE